MIVGVRNGDGERATEAHAIFHAFRAVIVHANCSFVPVREETNRNGVTFLCNVTPLFESADASGAAFSGPARGASSRERLSRGALNLCRSPMVASAHEHAGNFL